MIKKMTIPKEQWYGAYEEHWIEGTDLIKEAFKHPAKGAKGLGRRIVEEGLKRGWFKKGMTVLDPFG